QATRHPDGVRGRPQSTERVVAGGIAVGERFPGVILAVAVLVVVDAPARQPSLAGVNRAITVEILEDLPAGRTELEEAEVHPSHGLVRAGQRDELGRRGADVHAQDLVRCGRGRAEVDEPEGLAVEGEADGPYSRRPYRGGERVDHLPRAC